MDQAILQRRCTTGRQVWLVIVLALGLVLGSQVAAAKECARETPLPADVHLIVPSLEAFNGDVASDEVSVSGLIVNGVLYLRGCETRWGPDPYCRYMRHGVFSVTKSLGAAVALLWLAQTYGDQVFELKIKDYLTVTAAHAGWERVTFADALNMATGIGDKMPQREPNAPFADANPKLNTFLRAPTAKQKLAIAFLAGQYPWGPGEVMRYNNMHTFILAAAMDAFLKRRVGPQVQLWDMVVTDVFQPIGIFHAPMLHTQEPGGARGIPHLLHGLYPTIDDVAKLTTLLQQGSQHQGRQLLSAASEAAAHGERPAHRGARAHLLPEPRDQLPG